MMLSSFAELCQSVCVCTVVSWSAAAIRSMEDVAEYVNEMQRIHDEYAQTFDELSRARRTVDATVSIPLHGKGRGKGEFI